MTGKICTKRLHINILQSLQNWKQVEHEKCIMNKICCILDKNIMRFYVVNIGVTTLSIIF